jgi:hypothetical protein
VRVRNEDILNDLESVLGKIAAALPSPARRRAGDGGDCNFAYAVLPSPFGRRAGDEGACNVAYIDFVRS